jgi:hypothetical protein
MQRLNRSEDSVTIISRSDSTLRGTWRSPFTHLSPSKREYGCHPSMTSFLLTPVPLSLSDRPSPSLRARTGHFPLDVEVLCSHPPLDKKGAESQARMPRGGTSVLTLVAPFFQAGGRMTVRHAFHAQVFVPYLLSPSSTSR